MLDRRKVLGGGVVLGGSAWVAPTLLSTSAHAQGSTPTTTEPTPTTGPPPGPFAPIAMVGNLLNSFGVWETDLMVIDAAGHLRQSFDEGVTWFDPLDGGSLGVTPAGMAVLTNRGRIHSFFVFGVDGSVLRGGGATWEAETPLDIVPSVVTPAAEFFYIGVPGGAGPNLMVVDALGAVRVADAGVSPLVWTDPGTPIGIVPRALSAMWELHGAIDGDGRLRLSPDCGVTWTDPMDGGAMPLTPGAPPIGMAGSFLGDSGNVGVMDSVGALRVGSDGATTWSDPGPSAGINPVVSFVANAKLVAVGSAGDVRRRDWPVGSWSTPVGSPIT